MVLSIMRIRKAGAPDSPDANATSDRGSNSRATWQLANSLVPYLGLWALMAWLEPRHAWTAIPLAILAAGFLVRLFIIFHDCGHGSFLKSPRANRIVGFITGTLSFVPTDEWWHEHARHHATSGNLDRRGRGDVWTLTVREYQTASRWQQLCYRIARNPFVMLLLGPYGLFVIKYRFATAGAKPRQRRSVHIANFAILCVACAASMIIGFGTYLYFQSMILLVAGSAGIWLFYVQHQFEGVTWERKETWSTTDAALLGSSYYRLPRVLQWFTGNIGFHHVHHHSPGIPNYDLERAHRSNPMFLEAPVLTLRTSLRSARLHLWDESAGRLVGYPRRVRR